MVQSLASLALLLPNLAVGVRRLHDTGRSGWWLLIALIPVIGEIILIVFYVQDSQGDTGTARRRRLSAVPIRSRRSPRRY